MSQWQPIELAPKNGTWVLGYFPAIKAARTMVWVAPTSRHVAHWAINGQFTFHSPTHWMPLPEPPKE